MTRDPARIDPILADLPPPAPPDLVALVEAFGEAERILGRQVLARERAESIKHVIDDIDGSVRALLAALGRAPAPTGKGE